MFTRIFVPLDGSHRAEQALPVAARMARASKGTVVLARVVQVAPELSPYFVLPPAGPPGLTIDALEDAKDYLAQMARMNVLTGISVTTTVLAGMAASELLDAIETQHADLVVMTSHGRTGLTRWVMGSVARHVARQARVPVLVLRENMPFVGQEGDVHDRPLSVLVPLDGSTRAEAIIDGLGNLLANLRVEQGVMIHLVTVIDPDETALAHIADNVVVEGASDYLQHVAQRLGADYEPLDITIAVTWSVVTSHDVTGALIALADPGTQATDTGSAAGYDLVAMATHGRTGLARLTLGSITEQVFNNIRVPLFILRPGDIVQQLPAADHRSTVASTQS